MLQTRIAECGNSKRPFAGALSRASYPIKEQRQVDQVDRPGRAADLRGGRCRGLVDEPPKGLAVSIEVYFWPSADDHAGATGCYPSEQRLFESVRLREARGAWELSTQATSSVVPHADSDPLLAGVRAVSTGIATL